MVHISGIITEEFTVNDSNRSKTCSPIMHFDDI